MHARSTPRLRGGSGISCAQSISALPGDEDLVDALWPDRPPLSAAPVWELGIEYAGEARADKLARVRAAMADEGADAFVVTALDELAWLLDLRGNDVACTPVFLGFLLLTKEDAVLCAARARSARK